MDNFEPDSQPLRDVEMADCRLNIEQPTFHRQPSAERPLPLSADKTERMDFGQGENGGSQPDPTPDMNLGEDVPNDLVLRIPGMFRLLDLIGERGSDGIGEEFFVEKNGRGYPMPFALPQLTKL
jgi:hypothetical protein